MRPLRPFAKSTIAATVACTAALALAPVAAAHVGVDPGEISAGSRTVVDFSVGHGCDGSPTNSVAIQIPAGINAVTPQVHPGWTISVETEKLDTPIDSAHGDPIVERTSVVRFVAEAGNEVPSDQRDSFTLSFTAPEEPGTIFFKTVQGCIDGENSWIDEWDGSGAEPDAPAPSVEVVAGDSSDAHGSPSTEPATTGAKSVTALKIDRDDDDDDDDDTSPVAIAGVVLGLVGIGLGGAAFARTGRKER